MLEQLHLPEFCVVIFGLLAVACGASAPPPATHADFQAIQRQEAVLDETRNAALEGSCESACGEAARACSASTRICEIASRVRDADAAARCEAGRDRCEQYRASAQRRCECEGG